METKYYEREWLEVQDIEMWRLSQDITKNLSVLKLRYYRKPSHLKQCFAYCSLFPKKYRLRKEIICLWNAEGFISSSDVHSVDSRYFDSLLKIYFFQDSGSRSRMSNA